MGLRFVLGKSGSGKSTLVYQEIIKKSLEHEDEDFLILVPDQFTMQTQKEFCELHPNGGIMNIDVLSFSRLAHRIFDEVYVEEKTVLDDTGKNLVIRSVAAKKEEELAILGSQLKKIGYVHEVKSMISEFMQYNIGLPELEKMIADGQGHGQLRGKLKDLAVIYEGFLAYIKESYITTEESLDILREVLERSSLIRRSTIVLDGFTGFTPVQNKLIQEMMRLCKELVVVLNIDSRDNPYVVDGEHKLFYLTKKTIASLTKLAKDVGVDRIQDTIIKEKVTKRYENNESLAHLEHNIFRYPVVKYKKETENIQMFTARNPKEEVQKTCLTIRKLLREKGYYYRDIAVITGSLEQYGSLLEEECRRYNIPYFMDQNLGLMFHPMIHFVLGALDVVRFDFSYDSVFHFLRCGLCDLAMEDVDLVENYVKSLGIRGKKNYIEPFVRRPLNLEEDEIVPTLANLNAIREKIVNSLHPLLGLTTEKIGKGYVDAVYEFCCSNSLQEKMEEFGDEFEKENQLARAKEYRQVYRVVMDLLHQMHELLGNQPMDLKEFGEILAAGFSELQVSTIPPNIDQIVIGDMERTRLKKIKVLFFLGINDGIIPKNGGKGGLISDLDREFLTGCGYEMAPTKRAQMFTQKLYLYMNMTKPSEFLFLSYSQTDNSGKAIRPSYLVDDVKNIFSKLQVGVFDSNDIKNCVESRRDGYDDLANFLANYASGAMEGKEEQKKEFYDYIRLYKDDDRIMHMVEAAFYEYHPSILSQKTAKAIYSQVLKNSVSRLEQYAGCAYAHFVKYGLKLQPDTEFTFESVDMGTIFHEMLARFCAFLEKRGETLASFDKKVMEQFTKETLEEVAVQYGGTVLYSSARNAFIVKRMERILIRTFLTLQYQLKKGHFVPAAFEVPFEIVKELPLQEDKRMHIIGRIDRIDKVEKDGNTYLKIMDYKSGNKKFDPVSLYYGTQMQLAVYLHAAVLMEKEKKEQNGESGEVIPAAVLYYHMNDPFINRTEEKMSEEQVEAERRDALRMDGLINEEDECVKLLDASFDLHSDVIPVDRQKKGGYTKASKTATVDEFEVIASYVEQKMGHIGQEILEGKMEVNPYEYGDKNPCAFCQFASMCKFDEKIPGYERRQLDAMNSEEAMEKMRKAVEEQGK